MKLDNESWIKFLEVCMLLKKLTELLMKYQMKT